MVRIKDVAEAVGVSTATVSNVINGKDQRVSSEVRERIQKALDEMGYVRNRSAMMLADNDIGVDHYRWMELEQWLPKLKEYTALFVASDLYALEVSAFLQSRDMRIPDDISVVGFDDLIYARLARPKLTTISQNIGKKAQMAVEALLALRDSEAGEMVKEQQVLPGTAIQRGRVFYEESMVERGCCIPDLSEKFYGFERRRNRRS